ncbi:MAG: hypothetical protein HOD92_16125 [Deltaproteobacteria bacterium]|nr:hypothetical protein [Deltaproteobacteria bacterium]
MRKSKILWVILILIVANAGYKPCFAQEQSEILNQFQWQFPTGKISNQTLASVQINQYQIFYDKHLKDYAESFRLLLDKLDTFLKDEYQMDSSDHPMQIRLFDKSNFQNKNVQTFNSSQGFIFPYLVDTNFKAVDFTSFSAFNFIQATIKAHLIFGNQHRITISSHAFRFADGLSGYLALQFMERSAVVNSSQILAYLDLLYIKSESLRKVSSAQLLAQNASSEEIDGSAGYGQFLNGITLSRDSEIITQLKDQSSTADRIRVFKYIDDQFGIAGIKKITGYLKKTELLWEFRPEKTGSFCRQYFRVGCESASLDGTRSDIILKTVTGQKYAVLLKASKSSQKHQSVSPVDEVPDTAFYGFSFPKAGGSSESQIEITGIVGQSSIQENDILEPTSINNIGMRLSFGFHDDVYETKFLFQYTTGEKKQDDQFDYNNSTYEVPQTIEHTELKIGAMIGDNGKLDRWGHEMALLFHWIRIKSEWDMEENSAQKTDLEFINRGYFLLDWQNYSFIKVLDYMDIGLNYDFQTGLVSHSGSTQVARSEKYNKDTTTWILGSTIGPEIRFPLDSVLMDARIGANYTYLWQAFDEESGKPEEGKINSSQAITRIYASLSVLF